MKTLLLAGVALTVIAGVANAADLPAKMPVKAAPITSYDDWSGFYLGGYYATGISHSQATSTSAAGHTGSVEVGAAGVGIGIQAGYNWQVAPTWLVGFEGDFGWLGTNRSFGDYNDGVTFGVKTDWYGTLRGRLGYVVGPSVIYATAGGAFAHEKETFGGAPTTSTLTKWGWTAGGGIETKLSRNWSAKTEYLYIDLGSNSFAGTPYATVETATFTNTAHVLKSGLNYRFGGGAEGLPIFLPPLSSPNCWAGFYVGATMGGGVSLVQLQNINLSGNTGAVDVNGTGFSVGGHAGYNWIVLSNWVAGVEADIAYMGVNHSYEDWWDPGVTFGVKTDWYGTVRGRVGTTTGPALLYMTGGAAFVNVTDSVNNPYAGGGSFSNASTRAGWTFGGGIETALDSRWSARLETLYIDTGTASVDGANTHAEFKNRFEVIRAGLSYRFGGPDVITARY